jgi:hypothetical protein
MLQFLFEKVVGCAVIGEECVVEKEFFARSALFLGSEAQNFLKVWLVAF